MAWEVWVRLQSMLLEQFERHGYNGKHDPRDQLTGLRAFILFRKTHVHFSNSLFHFSRHGFP